MSLNKYVHAGRFHNLRKVLSAWIRLNNQYFTSLRGRDAAWWYNERAALSIFAAAAWNAGGVALEEFSTRKGRGQSEGPGRCDIYFKIGSSEFAGESKMTWLSLRATKRNMLNETLKNAFMDARKLKHLEGTRFGVCFVPVYLPKRYEDEIDDLLAKFQQEMIGENFDALAWCFPRTARHLSHKNRLYPGLFVILSGV
jgi:hypothetical protein